MSTVDTVRGVVAPILDERGVDLYDVELTGGTLRVLVDRLAGTKDTVAVESAVARAADALHLGQTALLADATARRDAATADVTTTADAAEAAKTGFARIPWAALGAEGEAELATGGVTVRCLQRPDGSVPASDDEPDVVAVVARAY